jgi:hypothetical protein
VVAAAPTQQTGLRKAAAMWSPDMPDRAALATSLRGHIDLYRMKKDIEQDRLLDPIAAGKLLAGIEHAERQIDKQPSQAMFSFALAPAIGLASAVTVASLFSTAPAVQAALRQVGTGVISGAARLGAI